MNAICKSAVAAAAAAMMSTVLAAPLNQLHFVQAAGWVNPTTDGTAATFFAGGPQGLSLALNTPLASPPASANTFAQMAWTSSFNNATSSLSINSYNSGTSPNGDGAWNANEWWRIDRLFQQNQVLTVNGDVANPNPLWVADILGNFRAYSDAAFSNLLVADLSSPSRIKYWETTNATGCPASPNPLGSICDDVYTVLAISLAPVQFAYDGYVYTVDFRIEPGTNTLVCDGTVTAPAACQNESGAQPGAGELFKVYASEGLNSEIFIGARWSARAIPVPEPSSLALVGLSLAGLGAVARRRRALSK